MTATTLPNLTLTAGFLDDESGWGDDINRALRLIDALVNLRVLDKDISDPPNTSGGNVFIVGPAATGVWAGYDNQLAIYAVGDDLVGKWEIVMPKESWRAWVVDENVFYQFIGGVWVKDTSSGVTPEKYTTTIGNGSAANFFIDHNLGTRDVQVTVRRNASPWDDIVVDVSRPSENQVEISGFVSAIGVDEYVVIVRK